MANSTKVRNGKRIPADAPKGKKAGKSEKKKPATGDKKAPVSITKTITPAATAAESTEQPVRRKAPGPSKGGKPMVRMDIPTKIAACCADEAGRYAMTDVAVLGLENERVLLAATDGRCMALVETGAEKINDPDASGLIPTWVPRAFGKCNSDSPRALRLVNGEATSLFSGGNTWVDDEGGSFREQHEGGLFPPIDNIIPSVLTGVQQVTINVDLLVKLAKGLNSPDHGAGLTLFIPITPGKQCDRAIAVIGSNGIGVAMPIQHSDGYHGRRDGYTIARQRALNAVGAVRPAHMGAPDAEAPADGSLVPESDTEGNEQQTFKPEETATGKPVSSESATDSAPTTATSESTALESAAPADPPFRPKVGKVYRLTVIESGVVLDNLVKVQRTYDRKAVVENAETGLGAREVNIDLYSWELMTPATV